MFKNTYNILLILLVIITSACGSGNAVKKEQSPKTPGIVPIAKGAIISEAREGDFVLQIEAEKAKYAPHEPVKLQARLKYDGDLPEVSIGHAASAFSFHIAETTRGIGIPYAMDQPLIRTVLRKGQWLEETYTKNGGYGDEDPNKEFIKLFLTGESFPEGNYTIAGQAEFILYEGAPDQPGTKEVDYRINTKPIQLDVRSLE